MANNDVATDFLDEIMSEADEVETEAEEYTAASTDEAPSSVASLRFETRKFVLQALLEKAGSVVPQKDILPVLKNFQLEATPGRLRVVATDLELSVVSHTEMVVVQRPGIAVFPSKKLLDIIKSADEGDVVVDVENGTASISVGSASWTLKLQSGDDYPPMPEINDIEIFPVDRLKFLQAIHAVRYAAAKDTTRPSLMMIDVSDGKMTACDGVRFQQASLGDDFPLPLQIPIGAVDDLVKLLRSTDLSEIGIGESESHLVFKIATDLFLANRLMAQFPNVEQLLLRPALENKHNLTVDRQDLVESVKRVRINADPETSAIGLELSKGNIKVISRDKFGNGAHQSIEAGWTGPDRLVVVNHVFLLDMINMYDGKSCSFWLGEDTKSRKSPILLRDDDTKTVGIVQQMNSSLMGLS